MKKKARVFAYPALFLLIGLGIGYGLQSIITDRRQNNNLDDCLAKQSGYSLVNPLTDCGVINPKSAEESSLIKKYIEEQIVNTREHPEQEISVYYRDLNNGPWYGINEQVEFAPASLLKVPLMMGIYKEAENNPAFLSQQLTYQKYSTDNITPHYLPAQKLEYGQAYTIQALVEQMIIYSDNDAKDTLLLNIDSAIFSRVFTDLSLPDPFAGDSLITVKEYASFFRILYNASYLTKNYSEQVLEILSRSSFSKGLRANIPANVTIAHKFGERTDSDANQLHDCGIVYAKDSPYVLCVMTRHGAFVTLENTIQNISNETYRLVTAE
jgi:beta-lactamase class A